MVTENIKRYGTVKLISVVPEIIENYIIIMLLTY